MALLLPVVVTTRNRSLRGVGSPVPYLDSFSSELGARDWNVRNQGIRIIRSRTEQRLSFSVQTFGRLSKGTIIDVEVEFIFDAFVAYTVSPQQNYAYFAVSKDCGYVLFDELLEKQPTLSFFNWETDANIELTSLSGEIDDIFGLWIRFTKREDLFAFTSCKDYDISDLRL